MLYEYNFQTSKLSVFQSIINAFQCFIYRNSFLFFHIFRSKRRKHFSIYGTIVSLRLVRDIVTGLSKGYAFVEFKHRSTAREAYDKAHNLIIDGRRVLVDYEMARNMEGWRPRRLGGGFGGKKESGQLRFGCRDRPWRRPIRLKRHSEADGGQSNQDMRYRETQETHGSTRSTTERRDSNDSRKRRRK